jgi:hypothetical protein
MMRKDSGEFVMVELIQDIERLENIKIAFEEGASDEKRAALYALTRMIQEKQSIIEKFEEEAQYA